MMSMMAGPAEGAEGEQDPKGGDGKSPKPQGPPSPGSKQAPPKGGDMAGQANRVGPGRSFAPHR